MISHIHGTILHKTEKYLVIDAGGIGYKVFVAPEIIVAIREEEEASLWTYLAVREDAMDLYGFQTLGELNFFEMLLDVSGIGPKGALAIIGAGSIDALKGAIAASDASYLTKFSGIGKKTAEKIILELRDKLAAHKDEGASLKGDSDSLEALVSLGYSQQEARDALKQVTANISDTSARVKEALKILGQK